MNQLQVEITNIEREIKEVNKRGKLDVKTFETIVRRRKEIWGAYFLDCLIKEKKTFEYANQKVNEDFEKLYSIIKRLQDEINCLKKLYKSLTTPMYFSKLKEWTKEGETITDFFVMPIQISDVKRLIDLKLKKEVRNSSQD